MGKVLTLDTLTFDRVDLNSMIKTLLAEAAGEPWLGKVGVCWVIVNRALRPGWWSRNKDEFTDDTIAAVCHDPLQFSCWNTGAGGRLEYIKTITINTLSYKESAAVCLGVLSGMIPDPSKGATHYHNNRMHTFPAWALSLTPTLQVGQHSFYNNVP